jgi:hypothetical protein
MQQTPAPSDNKTTLMNHIRGGKENAQFKIGCLELIKKKVAPAPIRLNKVPESRI